MINTGLADEFFFYYCSFFFNLGCTLMADYQYKRKEKRKGKGREEEEKELFVKACSGWQINMLEALSRAEAKKKQLCVFRFIHKQQQHQKQKKIKT